MGGGVKPGVTVAPPGWVGLGVDVVPGWVGLGVDVVPGWVGLGVDVVPGWVGETRGGRAVFVGWAGWVGRASATSTCADWVASKSGSLSRGCKKPKAASNKMIVVNILPLCFPSVSFNVFMLALLLF